MLMHNDVIYFANLISALLYCIFVFICNLCTPLLTCPFCIIQVNDGKVTFYALNNYLHVVHCYTLMQIFLICVMLSATY